MGLPLPLESTLSLVVNPFISNETTEEDHSEDELNKNATFLKRLELLFHTKTHFCKHHSPDCITNSVKGFISNFKIGVKIRLAFTLLQVLLRGGKLKGIKLID